MSRLPYILFISVVALSLVTKVYDVTADVNNSIILHNDGSVIADGKRYESMIDFRSSREFVESGRRCATQEPAVRDDLSSFAPADCSFSLTSIKPEYEPSSGEEYVIQTVFHVVSRANGMGEISDARIQSQLDVLNEDFLALTGTPGGPGTNAKVRFVFASVDPQGKPTNGIHRVTDDNLSFAFPGEQAKSSLAWEPKTYFNLYTAPLENGLLGYATFPSQDAGKSFDGVVIGSEFVGLNGPGAAPYDKGRTATHEIGHYFVLFHTFQGGCGQGYTSGDLINDTNPQMDSTSGCPTGKTSCNGQLTPIENYMDYSTDTCMDNFTPEQVNRIRCSIISYRSLLFNALPIAKFTFDPAELTIQFTDQSSDADGTVASWSWDFGDGNTSTDPSPSHTYADFGIYDVTLTVTDNRGVAGSKSEQITVNIAPTALFEFSNNDLEVAFTDKSSDQNGMITRWAWDFGDGNTSGAQSPTHVYLEVGSYNVSLSVTDDFDTTTTYSETITIEEGGCGCTSTGSKSTLLGNLGLLGLALLFIRRRKRLLIQKNN